MKLQAASSAFFVLRNVDGTTIVGAVTDKPLGWEDDEYFATEPISASVGTWVIEKGDNVTVRITSETPATVTEAFQPDEQATLTFLLGFVALMIWLLIIVLASQL